MHCSHSLDFNSLCLNETPLQLELRKTGAIIGGVWEGIKKASNMGVIDDFNKDTIANSLIQGNVDKKFKQWIRQINESGGQSGYMKELKRRGNSCLVWTTLDKFILKYSSCEFNPD